MTRQEIFKESQEREFFTEFMNTEIFPGWEDILTTDQIDWYWKNFMDLGYLPF